MKRVWTFSLAACAACLIAPGLRATTFELGFTGPGSFSGSSGDPWGANLATDPANYFCTLTASGGGNGAQGWSISMTAESGNILAITSAGTDAAALFKGEFEQTELTTGAGNEGAVSAIVLSLTKNVTLPPDSTSTIAAITVGGTIPAATGTATLRYVNGRTGSGQPVDNNITQDGNTIDVTLGSKPIALNVVASCCNAPLVVGFTKANVSSVTHYDQIVDSGDGLCSGGGGEIVTEVAEGLTGHAHVFAAISSNNVPDGGVQGWSFSIGLNGDVGYENPDPLADPTTDGTSVDKYKLGEFNQTEAVDPAKNGGQRGAVSAIVLSLTKNRVLPATSTETILDFALTAIAPQGDADIVGRLEFHNELIGSGQKVVNALTVGGNTADACNFATAGVDVVFRKLVSTTKKYVPGNANGDNKVDIADPIWVINQLFRSGPSSGCDAASDANGDGMVDATDATYLIAYEFQSGPAPVGGPGCATAQPDKCAADQASCP